MPTRKKKRKAARPAKRRVARKKVARKRTARKKVARKRTAPKRRSTRKKRVITKVVAVERVVGKRKRRRSTRRPVRMAGTRRRRSVGGGGISTKMLVGLGIGAAALYFLTRKSSGSSTTPAPLQLPPITQTSNMTRNNQANELVNYAIAAGLAVDSISKLINLFNNSGDNDIKNIYDHVNTTGDFSAYV